MSGRLIIRLDEASYYCSMEHLTFEQKKSMLLKMMKKPSSSIAELDEHYLSFVARDSDNTDPDSKKRKARGFRKRLVSSRYFESDSRMLKRTEELETLIRFIGEDFLVRVILISNDKTTASDLYEEIKNAIKDLGKHEPEMMKYTTVSYNFNHLSVVDNFYFEMTEKMLRTFIDFLHSEEIE